MKQYRNTETMQIIQVDEIHDKELVAIIQSHPGKYQELMYL